MKIKNKLTILIFLVLANIANAQNFNIGLLAGLDAANSWYYNKPKDVSKENIRIFYTLFSYNANFYFGYKSSGFIGLSTEPGYIIKGGIQLVDLDTKDDDLLFKLYSITHTC